MQEVPHDQICVLLWFWCMAEDLKLGYVCDLMCMSSVQVQENLTRKVLVDQVIKYQADKVLIGLVTEHQAAEVLVS